MINKRQDSFKQKIQELKNAIRDNLYLVDKEEIFNNFRAVDFEGLEKDFNMILMRHSLWR